MNELRGKTAIVTGGAGNIGQGCATAMAAAGANVVVADVEGARAKECAEVIAAAGGTAIGIEVDLAIDSSIKTMVETAVEHFGALHILHNNAAATLLARSDDPGVLDIDPDVWDQEMRINLRAPMMASKFAIPHIAEAGGGSIINTVSGAGNTGDLRHTAYGVSKAGLMQLTRALATQHGIDGIRCNAVSPGFVASNDPNRAGAAQHMTEIVEQSLVGRVGVPADIAAAVVFLASDQASFITGQILAVDGGASVHTPNYPKAIKRRSSSTA